MYFNSGFPIYSFDKKHEDGGRRGVADESVLGIMLVESSETHFYLEARVVFVSRKKKNRSRAFQQISKIGPIRH